MNASIYLKNRDCALIATDVNVEKTKNEIDEEFRFIVVGNTIVANDQIVAIEFGI